ncbi:MULTISPECIES: hypothetical protein [Bacillaceae]|uniref:hypothetical protein n=1 Tax=Bacillaceae TaxID=186817 RepID=UPI00118BDF3D|nr:hypothetical protein [Bacillus sp. S3]QCJ43794.1 hypothetical protein FAY30_18745 [Bacillus sp. S3]
MDKKQKISWGVSFGSLALVAGMVSYLGIFNGDKTDNQMTLSQGQQSDNNANQQSPGSFNPQQGEDFDRSWGDDRSSQYNQNDQGESNNFDNGGQAFDNSDQQQGQYSNGGVPSFGQSGHHHGFDTTTGGT